VLLTDIPAVRFALETPGGDLVTPATAAGAGSSFSSADVRSYYHHTFPLALADSGPGTWHAVLELDEKLFDRYCGHEEGQHGSGACVRGGARYSLSALAWSNLRLRATAAQSRLTPGATLTVTAVLDEYGVPVDHRAAVTIALTDPAGGTATIGMIETQPGRFEAATALATEGVHLVRVMASGLTFGRILAGYTQHDNEHRPHQSRERPPLHEPGQAGDMTTRITHRQVVHGLISEYRRAA
jgi:hypothetical protein